VTENLPESSMSCIPGCHHLHATTNTQPVPLESNTHLKENWPGLRQLCVAMEKVVPKRLLIKTEPSNSASSVQHSTRLS
jgi:hypothetical protein